MGLLTLFRRTSEATTEARTGPASVQFAPSQPKTNGTSAHQIRKDLLKLVLRDTLLRNGIPNAWLSVDVLRTTTIKQQSGLHARFLLLQWHPRLLLHALAFERDFKRRLMGLDSQAETWLMGFSWQLVLDDPRDCPELPHAGSWTAIPAEPGPGTPTQSSHDLGLVISGPVRIPESAAEANADFAKLMAIRNEDHRRHDPYAPTNPDSLPQG